MVVALPVLGEMVVARGFPKMRVLSILDHSGTEWFP